MTVERQGSSLGVHFKKCLFYRESKKITEERQGPPLGVQFEKVLSYRE